MRFALSSFLVSLLFLSSPKTAFSQAEDARMMVHLLDYIAVDYSMAVQNGKVISVAEYTEMQEFAKTLMTLGEKTSAPIQSDIRLLQTLVQEKTEQGKISSVANSIKQKIILEYQLEVAPKRWPSLANGKKLFALHCQSCHGPKGLGNGPLSAGLNPAPTNFHAPDKANGLSAFQAYNTIRLGVSNTGMRAFDELSDDEVWDLAFYILSLPHQDAGIDPDISKEDMPASVTLKQLASLNNEELKENLTLDPEKPSLIAALRLYPREMAGASGQEDYLNKAKEWVDQSVRAYEAGDKAKARNLALTAYLEGVEPVEVQLRANDAAFSSALEMQMGKLRSSIEKERDIEDVRAVASASTEMLTQGQALLKNRTFTGWLAFLLSSSIILREGMEAFLVILTILGIIRALKLKNAVAWIHAGWITAIVSGLILWFLADRFFTFSGAQREVMEGAIALFAVGVLLYVGFWMHSKSEAGKWQAYVKGKIQGLAKKENMLGLAFLSFLVVFREAFESVLFLSALNMEVGETHQTAFISGIIAAFIALAIISVLLLKYSKKIPISKLFRYSAIIIAFLAIVLAGKGVNAIQEAGIIGISTLPFTFSYDFIGVYSTWETLVSQIVVFIIIFFLWKLGNKPAKVPAATV